MHPRTGSQTPETGRAASRPSPPSCVYGSPMAPSTYRERLRSEGLTLAAVSAVASGAILATQPQARRWPLNTVAQLALAAAAMATLGRRSVRTALDGAAELTPGAEGDGDPTPLWQVPAPVLGLAVAVGDIPAPDRRFIRRRGAPARGWAASLRARRAAGCSRVSRRRCSTSARSPRPRRSRIAPTIACPAPRCSPARSSASSGAPERAPRARPPPRCTPTPRR